MPSARADVLSPHAGRGRPWEDLSKTVSIIAPTYNERDNIWPLVLALDRALGDIQWELIVVDDDSPDRTFEMVDACARDGWPVRCIRRLGRRGLASAVIEGALASSADDLVVIDADMQHDESAIPSMLDALRRDGAELVVASRYAPGGALGDWDEKRRGMSVMATKACGRLVGTTLSDPMSGFFAIKRLVLLDCIYALSQQGYKILLDIVASSRRDLKVVEVPYVFRSRARGESKLDTLVVVESILLMLEKASSGLLRPKLLLFLAVGCVGLICHLTVLRLMLGLGQSFTAAQVFATAGAMTLNFFMNNALTYRAERLRGTSLIYGYGLFCTVCSFGAIANISVANLVMGHDHSWPLAGLAGAVMSAVFNFEVASRLVWGSGKRRRDHVRRRNSAVRRISLLAAHRDAHPVESA